MMTPDGLPPGEADRFDPAKLFEDAVDASRVAGDSAVADAAARDEHLQAIREQGRKEGREALVAALLSELEAAKPNLRGIEVTLRNEELWREPGLTGAEARAVNVACKYFAEHLREWLGAGAPERPVLDRAWELINAQGGTGPPISFQRGYCKAIEVSLGIIEQLGGMDPAKRKAASRG